ncbi:MAG: hypothetical protein V3T41_12030, partial [bacterium]
MLSKAEKGYIDARGYWTPFKPLALFYRHQLERALTRALRRGGVALEGKRLLEDGCERGNLLRQLLELGASPERCLALDRDVGALRDGREVFQNEGGQAALEGEGFGKAVQHLEILTRPRPAVKADAAGMPR